MKLQRSIDVDLRNDVQKLIKVRHLPLKGEATIFRCIVFSMTGTTLLDYKFDYNLKSKFICKIKAEFLTSFLTQIVNHS